MRTPWIIGVLLVSHAVMAQQPSRPLGGEPPTAGVRLDAPSLVGDRDPSGVEINPASLGLLESWALMVRHTELKQSGRFGGGGDALLFGTRLPYVSSLALGLGFQWLRPADAIGYENSVKLSLALGLRLGLVSAGLSYHRFISDGDGALDGLQTLDLGLTVRPFEWLGAGLVLRDLNTPVYDGLPVQRTYDFELAARPLCTDRLELGAGLRVGERRGDLDPYFRAELEPMPGLRLTAGVELVRRDFYRTGDTTLDVRAVVAVGISLEQVGLAFSTILGRTLDRGPGPLDADETRSTFQGAGVTLRLQGSRQAPLFELQRKLLHLELTGELSQRGWIAMVQQLREVERRKDLHGVLLEIDNLECGWAQAQELRAWLKRLRHAGKRSDVYLRAPSDRDYYIAAAADRIMLDPAGGLRLDGMALRSLYFHGLLHMVGVNPQFVRIAEFKSAPESFTRSTASGPARSMRESLLNDLFQQMLQDIAADRKLTTVQMRKLVDQGPFTPDRAVAAGLVDQVVEPEEVKSAVQKRRGRIELIKPQSLARSGRRWPAGPGIAVVVVVGDIVRGKNTEIPLIGRLMTGDETIVKALSWARSRDDVKGVVLRINSPGGSAMASDTMWRAVRNTRKVKPVVVSMGDTAASGGYYIAAGGDRIFAEPATITGSIGIFTGKFDLSRLMQRLGISIDVDARGKHATMEDFERPYTADERQFILSRLQYYYRAFLRAVGQGRHLTMDQVHQVARGRVWTGRQAMGRGLVDRQGGLIDAIEEVQRRAGLSLSRPVRIYALPQVKKGLLAQLLSQVSQARETGLPQALKQLLQALPPVLLRARSGDPLARMPYTINLR